MLLKGELENPLDIYDSRIGREDIFENISIKDRPF
jgi:hypothetical protein